MAPKMCPEERLEKCSTTSSIVKVKDFWKNKPKDQRYIWTEKMPFAKLFQTETIEPDFKPGNAKKYFSDPNNDDKCSEQISIVHDPKDQHLVYYKGVAISEITSMKLSDGYCWHLRPAEKHKKRHLDVQLLC